MNDIQKKNLETIYRVLDEVRIYDHACRVLQYDQETICPAEGMEAQGETAAFLGTKAFELTKQQDFIDAVEALYPERDVLEDYDKTLIDILHTDYANNKNITPEMNHRYALIYNKAFVAWLEAKKAADFKLFAPSLAEVYQVEKEKVSLRETKFDTVYDSLLNDYETGMTEKDLDACFDACKARMIPLLQKIMQSKKQIRRDFMHRMVSDEAQKKMAAWLLEIMGFDFKRGAFTTSEHPFTEIMSQNDVRVTTHYYADNFSSSMFSIIHEGGHALFEMLQPEENFAHHLDHKTMGQHESVSRFYENRIGRSEAFVHLIYPKAKELFPEALHDVSEQELYEALNIVEPSFIRTEADEFTYTFHVIIRYEIEKALLLGQVSVEELPELWNKKYQEYLGITPENDKVGVLQDMHWTSGFGYFPTYAIGNMYNAMYYNKMKQEMNLDKLIAEGKINKINDWMKENVFEMADRMDPKVWIKAVTGRDFTPDDFLDYLEEKYTKIYEL